jgi:hypothetical protein
MIKFSKKNEGIMKPNMKKAGEKMKNQRKVDGVSIGKRQELTRKA